MNISRNNDVGYDRERWEQVMQAFWKTYMVPITVSGIGLFLALILGLVPLINSGKKPAPQQAALSATAELTSALEELRAANAAEIAELKKTVSAQARTISDFQNRLKNLDRGVKNTFLRAKKNKDLIDTMAGSTQRLSNLEVQMTTLNRAVPRISTRVTALQKASQ